MFKATVRGSRQIVAVKRIAIFDIMDSKARKKTLREVKILCSRVFCVVGNSNCHHVNAFAQVDLLRQCAPHQHIIRYLDR